MAQHPEADPWVPIADVLARAAGVDPSRSFDTPAEELASTLRGVRRDWDRRPCITWSTARELLESLRAAAARKREGIEARLVEADQRFRASLPPGIAQDQVPVGVSPALAMMLSDPELQRSRRRSVAEDALARVGTVFTPIGGDS